LSSEPALTLHQTLTAIDRAGDDERVQGLVVRLAGDTMDTATAQALHRAIGGFSGKGKPVIAHASSFGEFGPGTISFAIASAADTIAVQPGGSIGITGLHASVPFAADALALLGLEADVGRRGQYKTAPEVATESQMGPAHRDMLQSMTGDLFHQLVADIATGRDMTASQVLSLVNQAPLAASEAQGAGLIDRLVAWQDIDELLLPLGTRRDELVELSAYYADVIGEQVQADHEIALIYATGVIVEGDTPDTPFGSDGQMGAEAVAHAITEAVDDPGFAAIILRVDSGGGSAIASEIIAQAVDYADEQEKPLIVSMGSAAASGAYWLSANATSIVAERATLTGSIGVFAGKLVTDDLWDRIGVNWESISQGAHAGMFSIQRPFSPSERAKLNSFLDDIYAMFIERVSAGRGLTPEVVDQIAQGRVWTGAQAFERGLVDRLGGLDAAIDETRLALNLPVGASIDAVPYPPARELIDRLMDFAGVQDRGEMGLPANLPALADRLGTLTGITWPTRMAPVVINGQLY
ncbi:MAG: signal peptide peptidase SppA, partial [Pseudomonadota bacterium]